MVVTYIGKSAHVASETSINVAVPSGYAENDLLVLLLNVLTLSASGPTTPSGWTDIDYGYNEYPYFKVCYKIASSSENSVNVSNPDTAIRGIMLCFRGIDATTPINSSAKHLYTGSSLSSPAPTTTEDGCMVVVSIGYHGGGTSGQENISGWANSSLESIIEGHDWCDTVVFGSGLAFAYGLKATAGAINNTTATVNNGPNCVAITFAINAGAQELTKVLTATLSTIGNSNLGYGGFEIERKVGAGEWALLYRHVGGELTYDDSDVIGDETYTYRVRRIMPWGVSAWSNIESKVFIDAITKMLSCAVSGSATVSRELVILITKALIATVSVGASAAKKAGKGFSFALNAGAAFGKMIKKVSLANVISSATNEIIKIELVLYAGIDNVARKVVEVYVGVDNVARKVVGGFVGIAALARKSRR